MTCLRADTSASRFRLHILSHLSSRLLFSTTLSFPTQQHSFNSHPDLTLPSTDRSLKLMKMRPSFLTNTIVVRSYVCLIQSILLDSSPVLYTFVIHATYSTDILTRTFEHIHEHQSINISSTHSGVNNKGKCDNGQNRKPAHPSTPARNPARTGSVHTLDLTLTLALSLQASVPAPVRERRCPGSRVWRHWQKRGMHDTGKTKKNRNADMNQKQ